MTVALRLPGIAVSPPPPASAPALPPMDIAAFAGFAQRGPCHRAVAVDSIDAFTAVFGGDIVLARAAKRNAARAPDHVGHLADTVRAFFANGGRKCWVVRLTHTRASLAQWQAAGHAIDHAAPAITGTLPLAGVLHRLPGRDGGEAVVRPAWLAATSPGSWSDSLEARPRLMPQTLSITRCHSRAKGLRFADPGGLNAGALIEFSTPDGSVRRFARTVGVVDGEWHAIWCGAFARVIPQVGASSIAGEAQTQASRRHLSATLERDGGTAPRLRLAEPPESIAPGSWLHFFAPGEAMWMICDGYADGLATGRSWRQVANRLPTGRFTARLLRIELQAGTGTSDTPATQIDPGISGPSGLAALVDDDTWYAPADRRRAMTRPAFMLRETDRARLPVDAAGPAWQAAAQRFLDGQHDRADRDLLRATWLPLGVGQALGQRSTANTPAAPALERDGLAQFDETLFLDPDLADLPAERVDAAVHAKRDVAERQLLGMHALLDTPDEAFGLPTMLAVPDLVQPGWSALTPGGGPRAAAPAEAWPEWHNHAGGCLPAAPQPRQGPDLSRFLDADTRLLASPMLTGPSGPVHDGRFTLRWRTTEPIADIVVEESGDPAFAAAAEIQCASGDGKLDVTGKPEGVWYYRARAVAGPNRSAWVVRRVIVRRADFVADAPDAGRLLRLQLAAVRLAAGAQRLFALLSLPDAMPHAAAILHAGALGKVATDYSRPDRLGPQEARAASFAALYRGSLRMTPTVDGSSATRVAPPEGFVAGDMARLARDEGAWHAPANHAFAGSPAAVPPLSQAERLALQAVRANCVTADGRGVAARDAMTLSGESEWSQINVRRLMTLLRLTAIRRGEPLVFEPNGDVVRRALERSFAQMLDEFQRRGAFVGGPHGWRLDVPSSPALAERGQLVAEIGVAPAQPLRFLNFRLVRQGGRIDMVEAA